MFTQQTIKQLQLLRIKAMATHYAGRLQRTVSSPSGWP